MLIVKENEPSVAILMTTFNGETYLREQLASIENQHHRNWHLYVSDDCSTDQTLVILKQFASRHVGRVTISATENNLGFVKNFLTPENIYSDNPIKDAFSSFDKSVKAGTYPAAEHQYN